MKKIKNKIWLDRHAKNKFKKELKRRYRYNEKNYTTYVEQSQTLKSKKRLKYKLSRNKYDPLIAPENFSLYSNPEETLSFFYDIEQKFKHGNPVYFDMKNIKILTIDTIMYFLAILKGLKHARIEYGVKGSIPSEKKCKDLLKASGFFKYVNSGYRNKDLSYESDMIQISIGQNANPYSAKNICDFTMSKLNLKRAAIRSLYDVMIELMSNTKQHAYGIRYVIRDWYIFVRYISEKNSIRFIFLDTGEGIPTTVKRTGFEYIKSIVANVPLMPVGTKHTEYIRSALNGELRSSTGKLHRGKGLPKIYSFYNNGYIKKLTIISNHGYFAKGFDNDIDNSLNGTIYYWEI